MVAARAGVSLSSHVRPDRGYGENVELTVLGPLSIKRLPRPVNENTFEREQSDGRRRRHLELSHGRPERGRVDLGPRLSLSKLGGRDISPRSGRVSRPPTSILPIPPPLNFLVARSIYSSSFE